MLSHRPIPGSAQPGFEGPVKRLAKLSAVAVERIHSSGLDQAFHHASIHTTQIDAFTKIVDGGETTTFAPRGDHSIHGSLPHILDGTEAEADLGAGRREVKIALVHIRW